MLRKLHPQAGSRPGTLVIPADAEATRLRVVRYNPGNMEIIDVRPGVPLRNLVRPGCVTWIQVSGLRDVETLVETARQFEIHPLVLEDVVNGPQRPKSEAYDQYHLLVIRALDPIDQHLAADRQVSLIVGEDFVISFQAKQEQILEPVVERIQRPGSRLRRYRADYLAYAILDTVVDGFYPRLDQLTEQLQVLEEAILDRPVPEQLRQLSNTGKQLVKLRRVVWAQRDMVGTLLRDESPLFGRSVHEFLRDTHDHCVQIAEAVDMCRETVSGLVNTYLSSVGQHSNEVMKTLTIIGSIFIPLTFVAGIYGMNFSNMPELELPYAYPLAWLTMILIAVAMVWYFRCKGWLGEPGTHLPRKGGVESPSAPASLPQTVTLDYDELDSPVERPFSAAG